MNAQFIYTETSTLDPEYDRISLFIPQMYYTTVVYKPFANKKSWLQDAKKQLIMKLMTDLMVEDGDWFTDEKDSNPNSGSNNGT